MDRHLGRREQGHTSSSCCMGLGRLPDRFGACLISESREGLLVASAVQKDGRRAENGCPVVVQREDDSGQRDHVVEEVVAAALMGEDMASNQVRTILEGSWLELLLDPSSSSSPGPSCTVCTARPGVRPLRAKTSPGLP